MVLNLNVFTTVVLCADFQCLYTDRRPGMDTCGSVGPGPGAQMSGALFYYHVHRTVFVV